MDRRIEWLALPLGLALAGCPAEKAAAPVKAAAEAPAKAPASAPAAATATTAAKGTTPATREQVDPDGIVRRGETVDHAEAMTVAAVMKSADEMNGKTVTLTGEVTEVCVKKGCWMAIRGDEGGPAVRVTMKDYAYFVPSKVSGMNATVKGDLSVKVLDRATAEHYAEDAKEAGKPAPKIEAGSREVAIVSVGLELRR